MRTISRKEVERGQRHCEYLCSILLMTFLSARSKPMNVHRQREQSRLLFPLIKTGGVIRSFLGRPNARLAEVTLNAGLCSGAAM